MTTGCVWITGGGGGVGAALARRLADEGEQVVISGSQPGSLADVAGANPNIQIFPLDIADGTAVRNGVQRIESEFAPITLAVLNADAYYPTPEVSFDREKLKGASDVNLGGTLNCLGVLVPLMQGRRRGHVAILSSVAGFRNLPRQGAVPASKAALIQLAESLSTDLANSGVRVQVINPSLVKDKRTDGEQDVVTADKAAELILRGLRSTSTQSNGATWLRRLLNILLRQ